MNDLLKYVSSWINVRNKIEGFAVIIPIIQIIQN